MHRFFIGATLSLLAAGCNAPGERLNAPPHGQPYQTTDLQGTFTYMADNALLADMSVCDMHFLPHRAILNDLGVQRLSRLASLMEAYGGTIRFNTELTDEKLIARRADEIVGFLAQAGIDTTRDVVERDMPGGDGMPATEAILIRASLGTYVPNKDQSQGATAETPAKTK